MINKIFDLDNPVMRFLSELFDLMVLNLLTFALCIPIVTAVPALTALHHITLKMARHEQSYIVRPYFQSFKENFKQGFLIGLIFLAAIMVFAVDYQIVYVQMTSLPSVFRTVIAVVTIVVVLLFLWVIPLQAHFVNSIGTTFRNSVLMSLANFPRTLLMAVIWLIPVAVALISVAIWPLDIFFGLSVPAYLSAKVYGPAFKRFEPEEEEQAPDEAFNMDESEIDSFAQELHDTFDHNDQ